MAIVYNLFGRTLSHQLILSFGYFAGPAMGTAAKQISVNLTYDYSLANENNYSLLACLIYEAAKNLTT